MGDCSTIINGYSYSGEELSECSDTALVTIKNFDRNGGFKVDGFKPLKIKNKVKDSQYVQLYDILIACTDLTQRAEVIGNPELILNTDGYQNLIMSMDLVKIEPNENIIGKYALLSMLNAGDFKQYAIGCVNGTTVLHLDKKAIPKYELKIVRNKQKLSKFNKNIKSLYELRSKILSENTQLSKVKNYLLPKLLFGEIDVSELELGS